MLTLKRSASPDGRIDSLSVELSTPLEHLASPEIRTRASEMLEIQGAIMAQFLGRQRHANGGAPRAAATSPNGQPAQQPAESETKRPAVAGRMLSIGGMDGKWGRRLFITVQVNGQNLRLFGNRKQLGDFVTAAGFPDAAQNIAEGVSLNLPCRVTTKPSDDGRFTNIDQVLPHVAAPQPRARS